MADGGLVVRETPVGTQWLSRKKGYFTDWSISAHQTYIVRGTRTGIYKWLVKHAGYTMGANEGNLFIQLRSLAEPLGKQLQKAYGGAAMGGTPISAITGVVGTAATGATALGAGATAAGGIATAGSVLGAEVGQMVFDQVSDNISGPGAVAQGLDVLGLRDKYYLYATAVGPKHPAANMPGSTIQLDGSKKYDFEDVAKLLMTLKC